MPADISRLPRLTLRDRLRLAAAHPQTQVRTALAAAAVGGACGVAVAALRHGIDFIATLIFGAPMSAFETVPAPWTAIAPIIGGLLLAAVFLGGVRRDEHLNGPAQAMRRVVQRRSDGQARSFVMQYVGATVAVASGHSLGPSGPAVYLGALLAGFARDQLRVPLGAITACGAGAGIAASLDAPIAGVLFGMEVFLLRYTVAAAVPLSAAAVAAAGVTGALYKIPALTPVAPFAAELAQQLPPLLIAGAVTGAAAVLFNRSALQVLRAVKRQPFAARMFAAGVVVAGCGLLMPQIMTYSAGLDTLVPTSIGLFMVLLFLALKFLATAVCVGCGVPAGLIAPCMIIGATIGAAAAIIVTAVSPEAAAATTLYTLVCMGAMVGAVINAPLTSLALIFELASYEPSILIPGAAAVASAQVTRRLLAGVGTAGSIFQALLADDGIRYAAPAPGLGIAARRLNRRVAVVDAAAADPVPPADADYLISTRQGKVDQCSKVLRATGSPAPCAFTLTDCAQPHADATGTVAVVIADARAGVHRVYGIIE